ncbi:50S ribosomal protein L22 [Candidatus Woesearchaeota archaeon]|nr:50S ribosomal protein L22 [Candidatus Woesearchaeota archaeon]
MPRHNYTIKPAEEEDIAKAVGVALPISTKQSIEICALIRRRSLAKAKKRLIDAINKKSAIPFKRFNDNIAHKKGNIAAGKYPEKACTHILKLLEAVEANAQFKGLNTSNLLITHICAHKAGGQWHYGRQRRRKMKRTTVEVVVKEAAEKEKKKEVSKPKAEEKAVKKEIKKPEVKKEEKVKTK